MNEQIKELYDVAVNYTMLHDDGTINQLKLNHICAEKFAELIVRECACIADDMKTIETARAIKQHFGVEE